MNDRIRELAEQAGADFMRRINYNNLEGKEYEEDAGVIFESTESFEKFAELLVEAVLDEVEERTYYTGDRDWSDEVDRPWIQLEFGYGSLYDAETSRG